MFKGKNTYGDLNNDEKITTNILADRLECVDIISKHKHPDSRAKVLYTLTAKGIDLTPVLVEIIEWSEKHHTVDPMAKEFAAQLRIDKSGVIQALYSGYRNS